MNRLTFMHTLALLIGIAVMCLHSSVSADAEEKVTFAGRVVDVEGNPVPGFSLALQSPGADAPSRAARARYNMSNLPPAGELGFPPIFIPVETDEAGTFSITEQIAGKVQLVARDNLNEVAGPPRFGGFDSRTEHEIVSIDIGGTRFYQNREHRYSPAHRLTFSLKPGTRVENVEVTVQPRMRVQAQVVFKDGTPLSRAQLMLKTAYHASDGSSAQLLTDIVRTDVEGYFVEYPQQPAILTMSVTYQGLSATSKPIPVKAGGQHDIVLTFDSEPIAEVSAVRPPLAFDGAPGTEPAHYDRMDMGLTLDSKPVWIVNPANEHAYKRVKCNNWEEAAALAIAEKAHLVAINDEAEQQWVEGAFSSDGLRQFWIGLTAPEDAGEWRWTSGEPVTYTNWASPEPFPEELAADEKAYVMMGFLSGKWLAVGENSRHRHASYAILEKDGLVSNAPVRHRPSVEDR